MRCQRGRKRNDIRKAEAGVYIWSNDVENQNKEEEK